ncbi:hypothetical protein M9H77_17378 [Catharanthus roseus]|uniref:Uncharacterized protein n=1 Tax=Catharanthus roseus TaxID=4058 RepID=A0ACC0B4E4_CATRO|nr:hypothetical protein M9H77_17378 [Catharanthus roseus]
MRGRRHTMEFEGEGENVRGTIILCYGDLTIPERSSYLSASYRLAQLQIGHPHDRFSQLSFRTRHSHLYRILLAFDQTTRKCFEDSLKWKREGADGMTWDVQGIVELLQGPVARAMAKRLEDEH